MLLGSSLEVAFVTLFHAVGDIFSAGIFSCMNSYYLHGKMFRMVFKYTNYTK